MDAIHIDLTALDRLTEAEAAAVTLDTFVVVVAAETQRLEAEYLQADRTARRRAWED